MGVRRNDPANVGAAEGGSDEVVRLPPSQVDLAREQARTRLLAALDTGAFTYHFQPIVEIASGRLWGAEALLRWWDNGRWRSAADFVPLAITLDVLPRISVECLAELDLALPPLLSVLGDKSRICLNLAPSEVLADPVMALLTSGNLGRSAHRLVLELPQLDQRYLRDLHDRLLALHKLGYQLAVDNLGESLPSRAALERFDPQVVKVDSRSLHPGHLSPGSLSGVAQQHAAVHHAISESCHAAEIASAVSSLELAIRALNSGLHLGQGVHLAPPMTAVDLREWAATRPAAGHRA